MKPIIKFVKDNAWARYIILFIIGVSIGAIFYPSKTITETVEIENTTKIEKLTKELKITKEKSKEALEKLELNSKQKESELKIKISLLTTKIRTLKTKQKTSYYKIVRPDGTIEERRFTESEIDESTKVVTQIRQEFDQKVKSIENRWLKLHKERVVEINSIHAKEIVEYEERIEKLKSKKVVEINKRSTGISVGFLSNNNYFINVSRDLFGPMFFDIHTQSNLGLSSELEFATGAGIGLRW